MASAFPRNMVEFERRFRTDEACVGYLVRLRWGSGFRCPRCGGNGSWSLVRGLRQCWKCRRMTSITAGTIFHRSHLPLRTWFRAIWWFTNQKTGVSALGLQRALGLGSYRTAWMCLQKLRRAVVRPNREPLQGTVEVDETLLGGRHQVPGGRTSGAKAIVVIAVEVSENSIGRIRLKQVPKADTKHLARFVKEAVMPGATLVTDGWWPYVALGNRGYRHQREILETQGRKGSAALPHVHRIASLLKRWILGTHQGRVSRDHLDHYLEEFAFRFNRRHSKSRGQLFYRLLQQAVSVGPVPYDRITAGADTQRPPLSHVT